jgi:hypothetical protein
VGKSRESSKIPTDEYWYFGKENLKWKRRLSSCEYHEGIRRQILLIRKVKWWDLRMMCDCNKLRSY